MEKSDVLYGDHRLVGESFKQLDLCGSEGAHVDATRAHHSNDVSLLTQGNQQVGTRLAEDTQVREIILRAGVRDMDRAMLDYPAKSWFIDIDLFVGKTYRYRTETRT